MAMPTTRESSGCPKADTCHLDTAQWITQGHGKEQVGKGVLRQIVKKIADHPKGFCFGGVCGQGAANNQHDQNKQSADDADPAVQTNDFHAACGFIANELSHENIPPVRSA